jgi:hypothetical protein
MTEKINDGGPAFPAMKPLHRMTQDGDIQRVASENDGMSLRDWFAGMAIRSATEIVGDDDWKAIAAHCYVAADAMLAARERKP